MKNTHVSLLLGVALAVAIAGCETNESETKAGAPFQEVGDAARQAGRKAADAGQTGVEAINAAGDKTGVKNAVKGVSQVVVDTSEDIGRSQHGNVMGQDVTLFPPETENEGKILKIEF